MARSRPTVFLERALYRKRRLRDAARLLPIFGLLLLVVPLAWTSEGSLSLSSGDVLYFFLVWIGLIGLAAAFAPGLRRGSGSSEEDD